MTTVKSPGKPANATDYLLKKYVAGKPDMEILLCEEAENCRIAEAVYSMRESAQLTQQQLAAKIGTKKSAISRLEDADYEGHSLGMLKRIADALGYKVSLSFEKIKPRNSRLATNRSEHKEL